MWILRLLPKYIYPRLPKIVLLNWSINLSGGGTQREDSIKESEFSVNWRVLGGGDTFGDHVSMNTIRTSWSYHKISSKNTDNSCRVMDRGIVLIICSGTISVPQKAIGKHWVDNIREKWCDILTFMQAKKRGESGSMLQAAKDGVGIVSVVIGPLSGWTLLLLLVANSLV
jgi:hypothetical protein